MFGFIGEKVAEQVEWGIKAGLAPLSQYLKMLGSGLACMIVGAFLWTLSFFFLALALFFELSQLLAYVAPALYVFLCALLLGCLFFIFGSKLMRRPR